MWKYSAAPCGCETDKQYRAAAEALIKIKTSKEVKVQTAEEPRPIFPANKPHAFYGPGFPSRWIASPGRKKFATTRAYFRQSPAVINSIVTFSALRRTTRYQVNTEGTQLQFGQIHYRLELFIQGKAPDGMDINRYYNFDWINPADAPDDKAVLAQRVQLRKEMEGLVAAPLVEPYRRTRAAHRPRHRRLLPRSVRPSRRRLPPEGHQRRPDVCPQSRRADLPEFPFHRGRRHREESLGLRMLLGYYPFDDEGVPAERVTLVDNGVLRNFEMSRQPLTGFSAFQWPRTPPDRRAARFAPGQSDRAEQQDA